MPMARLSPRLFMIKGMFCRQEEAAASSGNMRGWQHARCGCGRCPYPATALPLARTFLHIWLFPNACRSSKPPQQSHRALARARGSVQPHHLTWAHQALQRRMGRAAFRIEVVGQLQGARLQPCAFAQHTPMRAAVAAVRANCMREAAAAGAMQGSCSTAPSYSNSRPCTFLQSSSSSPQR